MVYDLRGDLLNFVFIELIDLELVILYKFILGMIFDSFFFRWVFVEIWDLYLFLDLYSKYFNFLDECVILSFDFLIIIFIIGWGLIVFFLLVLCYICNVEVYFILGVMFLFLLYILSCLIFLYLYVEKL